MTQPFTILARPARRQPARQRGATLIIGLIMIVLITLLVVNAFTLSSSNLKAVGNLQAREEALAAANLAVEQLLSTNFTASLGEQTIDVDLNKDQTKDYTVSLKTPVCVRATARTMVAPSDVELGASMSTGSTWNTDWDIDSTVTDAVSGASVRIRQGVRVLLTKEERNAICPA